MNHSRQSIEEFVARRKAEKFLFTDAVILITTRWRKLFCRG